MVIYILGPVNCSLTRLILVFPNMGTCSLLSRSSIQFSSDGMDIYEIGALVGITTHSNIQSIQSKTTECQPVYRLPHMIDGLTMPRATATLLTESSRNLILAVMYVSCCQQPLPGACNMYAVHSGTAQALTCSVPISPDCRSDREKPGEVGVENTADIHLVWWTWTWT